MKTSKRVNTKKNITKNANVKKKRKGFTLVELLAAIAILGVIIGISTAVFIKIKNDSLQKEYENVVSYLENAAAKYARETGYTTINVSDLIDDGYAMPDDETDIYDPRTNESMNCYIIVSTFENSDYKSKLKEKLEDEDGKCKAYEKTSDYTLCKVEGNKCTEDDLKTTWFNDNITIGVRKDVGSNEILETSEDTSIRWSSTTGASGTNSTITTNVSVVSNATYKAEVIKDNTTGFGVSPVKIDKQSPVITEVSVNSDWASKKDVTVTANDFAGSGIYGIYLIKIKEKDGSETSEADKKCSDIAKGEYTEAENNKATIKEKEEGTYKACAIDNAGNYSDDDDTKEVIVDNTDSDIDKIELTKIPEKAYATSVKLIGKAQDNLSGLVAYMFSEDATPPDSDDENWIELENSPIKNTEITKETTVTENKTYYFWVKDYAGAVDGRDIIVDNVDLEVDKVEVKSSTEEYSREITLTGTAQDLKSGLGSYQFTTSSSVPSSGWQNVNESTNNKNKEKNDTYNITESITDNGTHYFWVKDILGNTKSAKITINNIDRRIDEVQLTATESSKGNIATLIGTSQDKQAGLVGYAFTKTSSTPTSWNTISKTTNKISYQYEVSKTGTYYFWVKDAAGNTKSTSVTISSIDISSGKNRLSSTYTGQKTLSNVKGLTYVKVDNGYVASKILSNKTVTVTVDGGEMKPGIDVSKSNPIIETKVCSGRYECNNGGERYGKMCIADYGQTYTETGDKHSLYCTQYSNGICSVCDGQGKSTCKRQNYYRLSTEDYYECDLFADFNENTKPFLKNYKGHEAFACPSRNIVRQCKFTCVWNGNYDATCSGYEYCENGTEINGMCYSCRNNEENLEGRTCVKRSPYTYYKYTITVYYWYN